MKESFTSAALYFRLSCHCMNTKPFVWPSSTKGSSPECKLLLNGVIGTVAAGIYQLIITTTQQYINKKPNQLTWSTGDGQLAAEGTGISLDEFPDGERHSRKNYSRAKLTRENCEELKSNKINL